MASTKEILALDKLARALEGYTEAARSQAGKELRKEALALEQAHGGAKRLDEAERILAGARGQAEQIIKAAMVEVENKQADFDVSLAKQRAALAQYKAELEARSSANAELAAAMDQRDKALATREARSAEREKAITARENALSVAEAKLATSQAAVKAREDAIAERESRIRAAMA